MTTTAAALGYPADSRLLILHVDDVGVCHGANRAFVELCGNGFVTSGSVMVPCPWFPEIAELAREQPELDLGVHLTLNSESRSCRWRPISTTARTSGLVDGAGYLWPDVPATRRHADRRAVDLEFRAQIDVALAAGIDVTHLDSHMGAAAAPEFVDLYIQLGRDYRLPVLLPRAFASYETVLELGPVDLGAYPPRVAALEAESMPVVDRFVMGLAMRHHTCEAAYRQVVASATPGITFVSLHCSTPGEVERLHPDDADWRIGEYHLFDQPDFVAWVGSQPVELIGYRPLRDHYRAQPQTAA